MAHIIWSLADDEPLTMAVKRHGRAWAEQRLHCHEGGACPARATAPNRPQAHIVVPADGRESQRRRVSGASMGVARPSVGALHRFWRLLRAA